MITSFNNATNLENYTKTSIYNITTGENETVSVTFKGGKVTIKQVGSQIAETIINLTDFQAKTLMEILQKELNYTPIITYRDPEFSRGIENQPVTYTNDDTITL